MKTRNKIKTRYSLRNVSAWVVLSCCTCLLLVNGASLAFANMGIDDIAPSSIDDQQLSTNNDRLTDFISGPVESISDSIIKVRGFEYTFSMNIQCMDMNDRPFNIEAVHRGDFVHLVFDVQTDEALSLILEQRGTATPNSAASPSRQKRTQVKKKIFLENGVYKY